MTIDEMKMFADRTAQTALSMGAETSEVLFAEKTQFEVTVRKSAIDNLTESVSSRISITISLDKRKATVVTSDLSPESIDRLISDGVELARVMDRDEFFDLPDSDELGREEEEMGIFDPETIEIPAKRKIRIALDLEKAACGLDKRIISDGASFSNGIETMVLANSLGFCDGYSQTFNSIGISCAADHNQKSREKNCKKQSSYWYSSATSFRALETIDDVASKAVARTLRKLGAVKPSTCEVPVVFDPETACSFLGSIAAAVNGGNIYRKSSFLVDMVGTRIGSKLVTIIDDPLLPGKLGTRPFDSEGVKSRRNIVVENGVLESYLMSSYEARKLGSKTTGNAGDVSNFYLKPGKSTPEEIIASVNEGLYLNSLFGPGANWATGDFSQGAQGIWIEKGKLSYPVDEFTVAGTFQDILSGIVMVGSDIDWKRPLAAPTFKIESITVSGT